MARIRLKDIAEKAGVSITTVSRVLNNKSSNIPVSQNTKDRVKIIAKELNYQPNANARALVSNQTKIIALVLPEDTGSFFNKVIQGIEEFVKKKGYRLILCTTGFEPPEKVIEELLRQNIVDGILIGSSTRITNKDHFINIVKDNSFPTVFITNSWYDFPSVRVDSYKGAYEAAEHMIKTGRKNIAIITGPNLEEIVDSQERFNGFKDCLKDNNLELKEEYIVYGEYNFKKGYDSAKKLLSLDSPPDGIFISEDQMAMGAMRAAFEMNVKIPEDLAIVGFDDIDQVKYLNPSLTTVSQPRLEMGKKGAEILIKLIEDEEIEEKEVTFEANLIIRESS
jgi:DNA-binding LacI/PurR family transcriptional regulator